MKCRTGAVQRIISSTALGSRSGSRLEEPELVRVLGQRAQPAGHRGGRRVVTGGGDDDVVAHLLEVGHGRVVDGAVGDERGEVIGGMRLAVGRQLGEVPVEVRDDLDHLLGRQRRRVAGRGPRRRTSPG